MSGCCLCVDYDCNDYMKMMKQCLGILVPRPLCAKHTALVYISAFWPCAGDAISSPYRHATYVKMRTRTGRTRRTGEEAYAWESTSACQRELPLQDRLDAFCRCSGCWSEGFITATLLCPWDVCDQGIFNSGVVACES